jgi:hypothetical protein
MIQRKFSSRSAKYIQYALTGAALGLYNGIFYRPSGDADVETAIELALLAAIVTTIIRSWKKGFPFRKIIKDFFRVAATFLIFMLSLVFREIVLNNGGKGMGIVECTLAGLLLGVLLAWQWRDMGEKRS